MFERFSDRARRVLALANQETQRLRHEFIGTEHILLGLAMEGSGVGANVLKSAGLDVRQVRLKVEQRIRTGDAAGIGESPLTEETKQAIALAIEEARGFSDNYVGTEHLLLGLLREPSGIAGQVLRELGLTLEAARRHASILFTGRTEAPAPTERGTPIFGFASLPLSDFLAQTAAKAPTPGGGAVVCASAAMAAALAQMVVGYSVNKKSLAEHQPKLREADAALTRARAVLLMLADEDAAAYGLVNELMKLPESDARRAAELPAAIDASIQIPLAAIATCTELLRLCETIAPISNRQLHSDLAIAAVLAESAARASVWNVRVNAALLHDPAARQRLMQQAFDAALDATRRREAIERECTP